MGNFTDPNYYDKTYHFTNTPDYTMVQAFALASGLLSRFGVNSANFNLIERVSAGYLMNTIDLTPRLHLVAGVRFEARMWLPGVLISDDELPSSIPGRQRLSGCFAQRFPALRSRTRTAVFARSSAVASSRPDPQDIAQASSPLDTTQTPNVVSLGNPNLKAEHSNNYDLLFEQYLNPVGILQAGFFYKQLSDPIVNGLVR